MAWPSTGDGRALISVGYDGIAAGFGRPPPPATRILTLPRRSMPWPWRKAARSRRAGASGKVFSCRLPATHRRGRGLAAAPLIGACHLRQRQAHRCPSIKGAVAIIDRASRTIARTPGRVPACRRAVLFLPDNRGFADGGGDRVIRRWDSESGCTRGEVAIVQR